MNLWDITLLVFRAQKVAVIKKIQIQIQNKYKKINKNTNSQSCACGSCIRDVTVQ